MPDYPSLDDIHSTALRLQDYVVRTPTVPYYGLQLENQLPAGTEVWLKMEMLQRTGSFKARGAINVLMALDEQQRASGVTAFSAGNHAIATAYAAKMLNISAKVAMPRSANPFRVERCKMLGADVVLGDDIAHLLTITRTLQEQEDRFLVHPFEGERTFAGTATVGLEFYTDAPTLDAVIVPIGGGGLISGIAAAVKQINPQCAVYGVEPEGARGMTDSLVQNQPLAKVTVNTIADSLGAPMHAPLSFAITKQLVDDVVLVNDASLTHAMALLFADLKLVAEPACAASMAALLGPLKQELAGKRVGLILCGSNIDQQTFTRYLASNG